MNSSIFFLIFVLKKLVQVQYFTLELQRVCTHMEKSSPVTIKALNYVCMHLKSSPLFNKVQNVIPSLFLLCTGHVSSISPHTKLRYPFYWAYTRNYTGSVICNNPH